MFDPELFNEVRKEFMAYLRYTKGHSKMTCYNYHSDLNIWSRWLQANGKDWQRVRPADVERFMTWEAARSARVVVSLRILTSDRAVTFFSASRCRSLALRRCSSTLR